MKAPPEILTVKGQNFRLYSATRRKSGRIYESHTLAYMAQGKRQRRVLSTREAALEAAKQIADQLGNGSAHVHALTPRELADYHSANLALRTHDGVSLAIVAHEWSEATKAIAGRGTIADAVSVYVRSIEDSTLPKISVADLAEKFCKRKRREGVSEYYIDDLERKLARFSSAFSSHIHSIRSEDIADWIARQGGGNRNANNLRNAIGTLFSFARSSGYLPRDKKTEAEVVVRLKERSSAIGIYTPQELDAILAAAPEKIKSAIAIAAFAGLRSTEIFRLDWRDIQLSRGHIVVSAEKAKTAQRRLVPVLPALLAWLEPRAKPSGRITPDYENLDNFTRRFSIICGAAGVTPQRNGFRHSFASYRLAVVKSADQVALEMGNSPRKLFTNYRELCTEEDAGNWFSITPDAPKNVTVMPRKKVA
jgi:integrase